MIERASATIGELDERERLTRRAKYSRRNRMHYIDQLLNELEMLNLADQGSLPSQLREAIDRVVSESTVASDRRPETTVEAMDVLYEIQDSLMFNEDDEEF